MAAIDVGAAAINRGSNAGDTAIGQENPANDTGTITSVEIWAASSMTSCDVGIIEEVSANTLTSRSDTTLGAVASGSKQTFSGLSLSIETGDYIGLVGHGGNVEKDSSGTGYWWKSGDNIPCSAVGFDSYASRTISLYGTGATAAAIEASVSEAFTTAETLARFRTTGLAVSENITAGEALADRAVYNTPAVSEALTAAEALAVQWALATALAEGLTLADVVAGGRDFEVAVAESVALGEAYKDTSVPWYNANWAHRLAITIDHTKVDTENQTDFPVYLDNHSLPSHFWENVKADGTDIVLCLSDGVTKLKREVVSIDTSAKTLETHVKIPDLSYTVDTVVYIYYGYAAASETNDTDTWDEWFEAVYHMNDLTTSTIKDSTSNGNDGTKKGANEPLEVAGTVGRAQDLDGLNDYITLPASSTVLPSSPGTIEEVATLNAGYPAIATLMGLHRGAGAGSGFVLRAHFGKWAAYAHDGGIGSYLDSGVVIDAAIHYHATTNDGTTHRIFVDGVDEANQARDFVTGTYVAHIGDYDTALATAFWKGPIDEVRISSTNRDGSWISTTNNTLMSPATFYSVGSAQHYAGLAAIVSFYTSIISEALAGSESLIANAVYQMAVSESATLAETLARHISCDLSVAEAMAAAETLAVAVSYQVALAESITLDEALAVTRYVYVTLAEALGIADSSTANLALYLLTVKLYARALTMKKPATSLTVKLHSRSYTAIMEA